MQRRTNNNVQCKIRFRVALVVRCLVAFLAALSLSSHYAVWRHADLATTRTASTQPQQPQQQQQQQQQQQPQQQQVFTCFDGKEFVTHRKDPDFIIAGMQKAGTTALYALLRQHPSMLASSLFEGHFFDMRYGILRDKLIQQTKNLTNQALHCQLHQAYLKHLNLASPTTTTTEQPRRTIWTFEKTPNYAIWPHIPAAIQQTCQPWKPKIVMVLRHPVDRLYSQYQMKFVQRAAAAAAASDATSMPQLQLPEVINAELVMLRKFGLTNAPNMTVTTTTTNAPSYHQNYNDYSFHPPNITMTERNQKDSIRFRGFGNHGGFDRYLQRGWYVYQLTRWMRHFRLDAELLVLQYDDLQNDMQGVLHRICDFVGAPRHEYSEAALTAIYKPIVGQPQGGVAVHNMSAIPPMSRAARGYLLQFYHPYNELLADLLGEEWRGIWET